jgi:TRAP-type C4-dicarboxylate transport system substrate-binding protein
MKRRQFFRAFCLSAVTLAYLSCSAADVIAAPIKAQISISGNTDSGTYYGAAVFKEALERESKGQIEVEIFPNGSLGASRPVSRLRL